MARCMRAKLKLLGLALATPVVLAGCRAEDSTESNDSPEAVHRTMCDAIQANDWEKAAACMDEESQDLLAGGLAFMISFFAATDDQKTEAAEELFGKYCFDPDEGGNFTAAANKPAFIAELFAFAEAHTPDDDFSSLAKLLAGRLTDLKTDGDEAGGMIEIEGQDNARIEFRRIDGRWLVHLPESNFSITYAKDELPAAANSGVVGGGCPSKPYVLRDAVENHPLMNARRRSPVSLNRVAIAGTLGFVRKTVSPPFLNRAI